MKLGQLRAAIRAAKGNPPQITVTLVPGGPAIKLTLQKDGLLNALVDAYPGGKGVETGLTFDAATGMIGAEAGSVQQAAPIVDLTEDLLSDMLASPLADLPGADETSDDLLV